MSHRPVSTMGSDSLSPQEVDADGTEAGARLSAEDLSVLPSRGRWPKRALLLLLLLALSAGGYLVLVGAFDTEPRPASVVAAPPERVVAPRVLPPPPPTRLPAEPTVVQPALAKSSPPGHSARVAPRGARPLSPRPPPAAAAAGEPASAARRQGEAVARFPDLPVQTLQRLADETEPVR